MKKLFAFCAGLLAVLNQTAVTALAAEPEAAGAAAQPASRTSMARISIRRRRWSTSFQKKSVFYIIIQNTPERKPPGVWMRKKLSR